MRLDAFTMFTADLTVTMVLGLVLLLLAWLQNPANRALGWWGGAHLILSAGILLLSATDPMRPGWTLNIAVALILSGYAVMWNAARNFERREAQPLLVVAGPCAWLVVSFSNVFSAPDHLFMFSSVLNASYCFAIAFEFWRGRTEPLISRWPAVVLQLVAGFGFLSWIPLPFILPLREGASFQTSEWFPAIVLVTLLGRVAMAFVVLAMAKERLELRQRTEALTDLLTGLPNRRAFFRQAVRRMRPRGEIPRPVSVLLFDLDRFKAINDRFGHAVGDEVLRVFAETLSENVKATDVVARVGGEEFAALLPDSDLESAMAAAERVRSAFANACREIQGVPVRATVSVGATAAESSDCNLHTLLGRADAALYRAKEAGRDCVRISELARHAQPETVMEWSRFLPGEGESGRRGETASVAPGPSIAPGEEPVLSGSRNKPRREVAR